MDIYLIIRLLQVCKILISNINFQISIYLDTKQQIISSNISSFYIIKASGILDVLSYLLNKRLTNTFTQTIH